MDVLRFECPHHKGGYDFRLTVSTATIEYAWERFHRRVKDRSESYCEYRSLREGRLSLLSPWELAKGLQEQNPEVFQTEWLEKHPVLFETCEYQFAVEFNHIYDTSNVKTLPKVKHRLKSVGEGFKFYPNGRHSGILVGSIDFLNSPGKFSFAFEYRDEENRISNGQIEMYVASPKLDTKNDLRQITTLINQEYENYVFDYLTLTFSSFSLVRTERNNNIIWLSIFKSVVDEYFRCVRFIMSRPNNKPIRKIYHARPERIRRWSPQQEERYRDLGKDAEMHIFRYEQTENTVNTRENRFVKYSLHVLGKKFREVFAEVSALYKDMDKEERATLSAYNKMFRQLETASFFSKVGEFEGFRQESSILQQRSGYSQIYKTWLMLKSSLELVDGKTDIGMKKIWELYEIWCFLVMKRLIAKVLKLDLNDTEHIQENISEMLNTILRSEMSHYVEFINPNNGDIIRLEYQHTYNRNSKEFKTTTTEQRPDIVVTIAKPNGFVLTYLYDAKYRVQDDRNDGELDEGVDIDIADYPLPETINQMHRYRDAIYYAMKEDERPRGKEIIGGYILFPGRTEGDSIKDRYFFKSIKKVNIGAFPLLPAEEGHEEDVVSCNLLEKHLEEILLNESIYEHIKDSIPQKGLSYSPEIDPDEQASVLVGFYEDDQYDWIFKKKQYGQYNIHTPSSNYSNYLGISYLLLYPKGEHIINGKGLYKIQPGASIQILSPDEMKKNGYVSKHNYIGSYFHFKFGKRGVSEFADKEWNYNELPGSNIYGKPFIVTLKQLKHLAKNIEKHVSDR